MNNQEKCIEYYFDSKTFTKEQLIKSIEEAKNEFPNKIIETNLFLNKWGVYILKMRFNDKNKYVRHFKEKMKNRKLLMLTEKNRKISEKKMILFNKKYGQYKKSGSYRPI